MKLPPQAKKVFSGVIFDTYQWEQELYDGTTTTFEMLKRPDTLQIIATQGDKILMAKQSQPVKGEFYSLFEGRREPNEDAISGAQRELLEESGMRSDDWELYKSYEPYTKIDWHVHVFIARDCKKVAEQNLDSGEKIEVLELTFDEFIDILYSDNFYGRELAVEVMKMKERDTLDELRQAIFKN